MTLIKNPSSFDLVIPREVEEKIRHLCSKVHDVEWSGTLFYKVEGSLDDGTFKATCLDICVMDIGSSGFTQFNDTEDIIAYRLDHKEELLKPGVYEGLVHSHNNMAAFFSGTDRETLLSEGKDLNHFLSLIVCNNGPYVARITRKLKQRIKANARIIYTKTTEYDTFENQTIILGEPEISEAHKTEEKSEFIVEYFEAKIDKFEVPYVFSELDDRLDEIKRAKTKPKKLESIYDRPTYTLEKERKEEPNKDKSKKEERQLDMFDDEGGIKLYQVEEVPINIVRTLCTQLMFGSILADGNANINLKDFAKRMDKVYFKRFGDLSDHTNRIRLQNWISAFVEVLIVYTVDEVYEMELVDKYNLGESFDFDLDGEIFVQLYAEAMIQYMSKLPQSEVKDMMIDELMKLMPLDYEQKNSR